MLSEVATPDRQLEEIQPSCDTKDIAMDQSERLDRIEGIIEAIATSQADMVQSQRQLLTAQVLLTDTVQKLGKRVDDIGSAMTGLAEAQKHTDERMDALIATVDYVIRRKQ